MDTTQNTHEEELLDIFKQLPSAKLSGDDNGEIRLINFSLLKTIADKMMNKAYHCGKEDGLNKLQSMIDNAFSH